MKTTLENKRKYIYLLILMSLLILYVFSMPFKSISTEIVMLFTSKSSQLIVGYLNKYDTFIKPVVSIGLMIFQAIIAPFKYEIIIFANIKVFGLVIGFLVSVIGRIIGAYICFDIGRVLRANKFALSANKMGHHAYLVPILIRLIPVNFDFLSYLSGVLRLNARKYMIVATGWIILTTGLYAVNEGYFSYSWERTALMVRLGMIIVIGWQIMRERNSGRV